MVGQTLSRVCVKKGYTVVLGSEHISEAWQELHPKIKVVSYDVAASEADFIILGMEYVIMTLCNEYLRFGISCHKEDKRRHAFG